MHMTLKNCPNARKNKLLSGSAVLTGYDEMTDRAKRWLLIAAATGTLSVAIGAFGAHGVPSYLESRGFDEASIDKRLDDFHTAARYHTYGALFLCAISLIMDRLVGRAIQVAAWCMLAGLIVFSGAVYAVALVPEDMRGVFGMLAPLGGSLMIAAWVALAVAAVRSKGPSKVTE